MNQLLLLGLLAIIFYMVNNKKSNVSSKSKKSDCNMMILIFVGFLVFVMINKKNVVEGLCSMKYKQAYANTMCVDYESSGDCDNNPLCGWDNNSCNPSDGMCGDYTEDSTCNTVTDCFWDGDMVVDRMKGVDDAVPTAKVPREDKGGAAREDGEGGAGGAGGEGGAGRVGRVGREGGVGGEGGAGGEGRVGGAGGVGGEGR